MDVFDQILERAQELFFTYGVKSTTMDDLAKAMGASKKTIYQYVNNKADLVSKTMEKHLRLETETFAEIKARDLNAIEEMLEISRMVTTHLKSLNPTIINDLQKYYPTAWAQLTEFKNNFISKSIEENIRKGMEEGLYRDDLNPNIVAKLYSARTDCIVDQKIFPFTKYTVIEVYKEFLYHHIRGIATEKGLAVLDEKIKNDAKSN